MFNSFLVLLLALLKIRVDSPRGAHKKYVLTFRTIFSKLSADDLERTLRAVNDGAAAGGAAPGQPDVRRWHLDLLLQLPDKMRATVRDPWNRPYHVSIEMGQW